MLNINVDEKAVVIGLEAACKEEVIEILAKILELNGYVKETYCEAVLSREKVFPTGLAAKSLGIAIPHTDIIHVNKAMIAVALLKDTVEFQMMGDNEKKVDVKVVFMLAMKDGSSQLSLLSNLMNLIQEKENLEFLNKVTQADQVVDFLNLKLNK